jgi:choline dehydrogenase-like flavoprotein
MGSDPGASVVDANSRAHSVPNLLILDGSVFATAAALNPTSTIQALALRAAAALIRDRAQIPVAA